ncbi:type IV pilus modification PilV family protein [Paenibacillus lignilyticus]|uniref:Prepilin-type N-terminal cleavage/methylation domain-containing protein n=1 Tax=Paenibacillus lignilyticus TaxID=1172615 RepID=A0ABS5CLU3_9BACL|nr:prepilin-type N-terminal cleavage/methylation domain-containing protein [Paenibacillus lignilyticus]MBP3966840.1 prepilin-type N-terminal cleavage/methylation domain-containing protein [Paenibacillus lignilyticus]
MLMKVTEQQQPSGESGFTLVEILTCLIILSVAGLAMTGFFVHALSYAKGNQNKTVMVNLARNTLFYMQKQADFDAMQTFFKSDQPLGIGEERNVISSSGCAAGSGTCTNYKDLVGDPQTLVYILNPKINDILYHVTISFQENLYDSLDTRTASPDGGRIDKYLLPIKVEVEEAEPHSSDNGPSKRERSEVEGYITDESIR